MIVFSKMTGRAQFEERPEGSGSLGENILKKEQLEREPSGFQVFSQSVV